MFTNKWIIAVVLVTVFWQPLQPIRYMTADALALAATWIRD
jgi:hypothetical protein